MNQDDYYHRQLNVDQYVEMLLQKGYIGQHYTTRIVHFHELRSESGVIFSKYAFCWNKITQYENLMRIMRSNVQALNNWFVMIDDPGWVDWHMCDEEREREIKKYTGRKLKCWYF